MRKWMVVAGVAVLAVGALALGGCGSKAQAPAKAENEAPELTGSLTIAGSDTMVNMANAWAEGFMAANPGVTVAVKGGGSGTGIAALINGTVDFADASRDMKEEEIAQAKGTGITPTPVEVAKDGIAVIVNPANKVASLTKDQLGAIYRGEITNWKAVGGADEKIVLISRDPSSGTYEYFKDEVVGKDKEYAKSAKLLPTSSNIVDEVKANKTAIGYVGIGYITPDVTVVAVDGKKASLESVLDGSYVLSRGLLMIGTGEAKGAAKAYLDWILGPEGQKVVADEGFVPLGK